jgi:predicted transcriptional regulator
MKPEAAMTDAKEILTPELIQRIEETARRENRRPSEVLEEAWHRYVEEKSWVELVERGLENAKRLGIQESDIDRLISDYRAEKRAR